MHINSVISKLWKTSQPKPWKLEKPVVIQFPVNDICNSRCQMCNIWQKKLDHQISAEELASVLENPLFSKVRSVGVNGGEPTLRKDLAELVDVLYKKLPNLNTISLITNAYQDQIVIQRIKEIGQIVQRHGGYFDVMVSIDGVGEVHDRVRGKTNNFARAVNVIDFVQASDLVDCARLGCTVIRDNVYDLHNLLEFAISKDIYVKYRIGIPHQRLYSQDVVTPFALTFEEVFHFVVFIENLIAHYETSYEQILFYQSLIGQLIYGNPRTAGCNWQHRGATLSARGELLYCAVKSKTLGSAITQDAEELYFANSNHLDDIIRTECDSCLHDYTGLPSRSALLGLYKTKMTEKLQFPLEFKNSSIASQIRFLRQKRGFETRLSSFGVEKMALSGQQPTLNSPRLNAGNPKVLICGWYGTETVGDKAILGGVVQAIAANFENPSFYIASLEVYVSEMTLRQMPELENCSVCSISEALEAVSTMDIVVFGGGPLMAIPNLAEILAIFQRAEESGIATLVAGCGVGPLNQSFHSDAIRAILALSSWRVYRDQNSLQLAQNLGVDTKTDQVAEDPAFTWLQHTLNNNLVPERGSSRADLKLLLGLRDWPFRQYATHLPTDEAQKFKDHFEREVVLALELLLEQYPDLTIVPFPMCTNHIGGDDRWFYRRLFRDNSKISPALNLDYLGAEVAPSTAVDLFQTASAALTMRYHSLIFALACGTPAVSIDYTLGKGKVYILANKYNVPQLSLDSLNRTSIFEMLAAALAAPNTDSVFESRDLKFENAISSCISSF